MLGIGEFVIRNGILHICDGDGNVVNLRMTDRLKHKLSLLIQLDVASVLEEEVDNHTLFFGPYISGNVTGFVFQVIDLATRDVVSLRIPFGKVKLSDVKDALKEALKEA